MRWIIFFIETRKNIAKTYKENDIFSTFAKVLTK